MHAFIVTKMGSVRLGSCVFPHRHAQHSYAQKASDSERVGRCRTQKGSEDVGLRKGREVSDSEKVGRCRTQRMSGVGLRECQKVSESVNGTLAENAADCTDMVIIRLARCPCTSK